MFLNCIFSYFWYSNKVQFFNTVYLGQKSLSVLHRIDSTMIWNSYIYNKNYKWLSYNLWFVYTQFYKIIFFIDQNEFIIYNNLHYTENTFLTKNYNNCYNILKNHKRFSYYIDLYCIEFYNYLILLNLYFQTDLLFFKKKKKNSRSAKKYINNDFLGKLHYKFV